jgi:hypothetical protein
MQRLKDPILYPSSDYDPELTTVVITAGSESNHMGEVR